MILTYLLTYSLSYPKSRDAIASKKQKTADLGRDGQLKKCKWGNSCFSKGTSMLPSSMDKMTSEIENPIQKCLPDKIWARLH